MKHLWKVIVGGVIAAALVVGYVVVDKALNPPLPKPRPVREARWLNQNWSSAERYWFHHASQGTSTLPIPYKWFVSLAEPSLSPFAGERLFARDAYMQKFGFIPSPRSGDTAVTAYGYAAPIDHGAYSIYGEPVEAANPDGLPVGFAVTKGYPDPVTGKPLPDQIGLTCAACHTGHLEYKGVSLRIDGANAAISLPKLTKALGGALLLTDLLPWRFDAFAKRVLGPDATRAQKGALRAQLKTTLAALSAAGKATAEIDKTGVDEGFNRLDALNRIGNAVFYVDLLGAKTATFDPLTNYAAITAPVKYPQIWNAPWFEWAQYDGSILQPVIRNAGEAMGVAAKVNMVTYQNPGALWTSSVNVHSLARMEELIEGGNPMAKAEDGKVAGFTGLTAPKWPEDVLGKLDAAKVAAGRQVYARRCQGCHLPPVGDPDQALYKPAYWTAPNARGESYLKTRLVDQSFVGTDPGEEEILRKRNVTLPLALGVQPGVTDANGVTCFTTPTSPRSQLSFGQALASSVQLTVDKFFTQKQASATLKQRLADKGNRPNCIQAKAVYKARPLNGIWAAPPYLHNGSVPSLAALLSADPARDRPKTFCLGNRAYDPTVVGLDVAACARGSFKLDTSVKGNSNRGHEFRDGPVGKDGVIGAKLSDADRMAVIEFLKSQ